MIQCVYVFPCVRYSFRYFSLIFAFLYVFFDYIVICSCVFGPWGSLGVHGRSLGRPWKRLGVLGASWCVLGSALGGPWGSWSCYWEALGGPQGVLGGSWGSLGGLCGFLGGPGRLLGDPVGDQVRQTLRLCRFARFFIGRPGGSLVGPRDVLGSA